MFMITQFSLVAQFSSVQSLSCVRLFATPWIAARQAYGNTLQNSCLKKSHGRRSLVGCSPWGLEESDTTERLHFHFSALEKEMATHCIVLAWRIPGMGSHRVGHDWSDLAGRHRFVEETKWFSVCTSKYCDWRKLVIVIILLLFPWIPRTAGWGFSLVMELQNIEF